MLCSLLVVMVTLADNVRISIRSKMLPARASEIENSPELSCANLCSIPVRVSQCVFLEASGSADEWRLAGGIARLHRLRPAALASYRAASTSRNI